MGKFTTSILEEISISKIKEILRSYKIFKSFINENDKEPSWDGFIFVYNKENTERKDELRGRIPIQIKATEVEKIKNKKIPFSMKLSDLNNYFNDGGVMFFVVEINEQEECRIFLKSLLPVDIKIILEQAKNKNNTKFVTVQIDKILKKHSNFKEECYNFLLHKQNQGIELVNRALPLDKISTANIRIMSNSYMPLGVDTEIYPYIKDNLGQMIPVLTKIKIDEIGYTLEKSISAKGKEYFSNYIYHDGNEKYIEFGDVIRLDIIRNKIDYLESEKYANERLKTLQFLQMAVCEGCFYINDELVELALDNESLTGLEEELQFINRLKIVCDKFHIDFNKICLKDMTNKDAYFMKVLENIQYEWMTTDCIIDINSFTRMRFLDNDIILWKCISGDKTDYIDFYAKQCKIVLGGDSAKDKVFISRFSMLEKNLLKCVNFDKETIIDSIVELKEHNNEFVAENYNLFVLELIKVWDEINDNRYLEVADFILDWIEKNLEEGIFIINKAQIEYRLNKKLSFETLDQLYKIKFQTKDISTKAAIEILIGNRENFKSLYDEMKVDEKSKFSEYPIYNLFKKILMKII